MSIRQFMSSDHSVNKGGPRVWQDAQGLHVRTSCRHRLLSLFSYCRMVHISTEKQQVIIRERTWWFVVRMTIIPFGRIEHIDRYDREVFNDPSSPRWSTRTGIWYVRAFVTGMPLPVNLARFTGRGLRAYSEWQKRILGGYATRGLDESRPESFARLVAEYTGRENRN